VRGTDGWVEDDTARRWRSHVSLRLLRALPTPSPTPARHARIVMRRLPRRGARGVPLLPSPAPGGARERRLCVCRAIPFGVFGYRKNFRTNPRMPGLYPSCPLIRCLPAARLITTYPHRFVHRVRHTVTLSVRNVVGSLHSISLNLSKNLCTII
jgi:hypothetical protein